MVTLSMIVKNEQDILESCIEKISDLVDEIIIVDTGSTDRTKDIASRFTDKVYDFKWCNDFSKARNFSIEKASNDWVLVLDADEVIERFNKETVIKFINDISNYNKVGRIQRVNIMDDGTETKKHYERINRLFNRKCYCYNGRIHEQVSNRHDKTYETEDIDILVNHIGYTKEVLAKTNKIKRNIDLLNMELETKEEDPYIYYQLGKSYYMLKDYDKAVSYFETSLGFDLNYKLEYASDLVDTYGYSLINSGKYEEALRIKEYYNYYKESPDFNFLMALIYMNNAKFSLAVETFIACTKLKNPKVEGVNSYLAYKNIGIIYEVLGFKEEAKKYYSLSKY